MEQMMKPGPNAEIDLLRQSVDRLWRRVVNLELRLGMPPEDDDHPESFGDYIEGGE